MAWLTPKIYNVEMCQIAVDVMSNGYPVVNVAAKLNVSRKTIYQWMNDYPEFAAAIEIGKVKGEALHNEIGRQALGKKDFQYNVWAKILQRNYQDSWDRKVTVEGLEDCKTYDEEIDCIKLNVARGNLTPKEGETMTNIISAKVKAYEITKVKPLIDQLEAEAKERK